MSVQWYYMKNGWFRSKRIGPISEQQLLHRIDSSEIHPETLIRCETKTRGEWVKMKEVSPALKRWTKLHPAA